MVSTSPITQVGKQRSRGAKLHIYHPAAELWTHHSGWAWGLEYPALSPSVVPARYARDVMVESTAVYVWPGVGTQVLLEASRKGALWVHMYTYTHTPECRTCTDCCLILTLSRSKSSTNCHHLFYVKPLCLVPARLASCSQACQALSHLGFCSLHHVHPDSALAVAAFLTTHSLGVGPRVASLPRSRWFTERHVAQR